MLGDKTRFSFSLTESPLGDDISLVGVTGRDGSVEWFMPQDGCGTCEANNDPQLGVAAMGFCVENFGLDESAGNSLISFN